MQLKNKQELLIHLCSFIFLLFFSANYDLKFMVFVIALAIMVFNLWKFLKIIIQKEDDSYSYNYKSPIRNKSGETPQNIKNFEKHIRNAYKRIVSQQATRDDQSNFWTQNYTRKSQQLEELGKLKLSDLSKDRINNQQDYSYRDQGSSAKKLRNYMMSQQDDSPSKNNELETLIVQQITPYYQTLDAHFKILKLENGHIKGCIFAVKEYMNNKLQIQMEDIIADLEEIDKCLQKCFSLTLTLQPFSSQYTITYSQLIELLQIIQKKTVVPQKFTKNMSAFDVKREIGFVKNKILRLPNFTLAPNILRLVITLKHLKKDFPEEQIMFSDFERNERVKHGQQHHFRILSDDRIFYHNYANIKSKQGAISIVLFLLHILKRYTRSNKSIIKQILSQINFR